MYYEIPIQKLSHPQILKLLKGERIRVKHGQEHKIKASAEQHKKIMSAHKKGKGCCIQLDPYQRQMPEHLSMNTKKGKGFWGDLAKGAFKELAPVAIDYLGGKAKDYVSGMGAIQHGGVMNPMTLDGEHYMGLVIPEEISGEGKKKRGRPSKKGCGLPPPVPTHPVTIHPHSAHSMKKRGRPSKKGEGVGSDLVSAINKKFFVPKPTRGKATAGAIVSGIPFVSKPVVSSRAGKAPARRGKGKISRGDITDVVFNALPPRVQDRIDAGLDVALGKFGLIKPKAAVQQRPVVIKNAPTTSNPLSGWTKTAASQKAQSNYAALRQVQKMSPAQLRGKGVAQKKEGGALYPAGYENKKGNGKKGKGVIGSLLGKVVGGVAGKSLGGDKGGEIGSLLGTVAGELLPF